MKIREIINEVLENQNNLKTQLNRIESMLRKNMLGTEELPFDLETTGYVSVSDLKRLGASTRMGKDGKEYLWAEKIDVPEVLKNAKEHNMLEEARDSINFFVSLARKNAEKFMTETARKSVMKKLDEKIEECLNFDKPVEEENTDLPF